MTKTVHFHWENRFVLQQYGALTLPKKNKGRQGGDNIEDDNDVNIKAHGE